MKETKTSGQDFQGFNFAKGIKTIYINFFKITVSH